MSGLAVRVGVALGTGVTGCCVLTVVKGYVGWQGGFAYPAQGFCRVGRVVGVGCGVQGQQARIVSQYMAVAVQAGGGSGQPGPLGMVGSGVAGPAVHGCTACRRVGGVIERKGLHRLVRAAGTGVQVAEPEQ